MQTVGMFPWLSIVGIDYIIVFDLSSFLKKITGNSYGWGQCRQNITSETYTCCKFSVFSNFREVKNNSL